MKKHLSIIFGAVAALFLASCGQGDVLYVDKAVINLSPVDGNPSSGYLELHGGRQDVALVGVTAADARRVEMHESTETDGVTRMQPIKSVPVPAGETVKFEPGGKHLMLWGIGGGSVKQGFLTMTFIFSNDDRIQIEAAIQPIGGAAAAKDADQEQAAETDANP